MPIAAAKHGVQCARLAMNAGCDEETVLACLLHDVGLAVNRPDHGWWGAHLVEPYVSERVSWAIRYHQALRCFADPSVGYAYPEMYCPSLNLIRQKVADLRLMRSWHRIANGSHQGLTRRPQRSERLRQSCVQKVLLNVCYRTYSRSPRA